GMLLPRLELTGPLHPVGDYLPLLPLMLVIWGVLLLLSPRYRSQRTTSILAQCWGLVRLSAMGTILLVLAIYLFRLDVRLLAGRSDTAFAIGAVEPPQVTERPSTSDTMVRWRAVAHTEGGAFRLYAGPVDGEMGLIAEQAAAAGMTNYSVALPEIEGSTYRYELRYVDPRGRETLLQSALVYDHISRLLVVLFAGLAALFLVGETLVLRLAARQVRRRGYNYRQVVIAGTGEAAAEIADTIRDHPDWGLKVLGFVSFGPASEVEVGPILGSADELPRLAEQQVVDEVIFTTERRRFDDLEDLVLQLEELGVTARFALTLFPKSRAKPHLEEMGGTPMMTFSTGPTDQIQLFAKRAVDLVVAAVALVLLAPLIALVALLIKATSKGPVFFRQERCGLNGRRFTLYKFRTMVEGAEAQLEELRARNEMRGPVFKLRDDPRVTPVGRLLRRFSLDELPQLWNVLRGHMSLVGPRPPVPQEVAQYRRWQRRRLSMRPGLTCLWQVSGRNEVDFERWMELDLEYIDSWSPRLDVEILVKTIPAVLSGRGAS
ncbi:MAG: sugar transferase, partial [Thermoanaerobaculia bacterium]|nr:sugar transferase [Thermoanaerobaculia bacterium]